jgi:hypothetical protein
MCFLPKVLMKAAIYKIRQQKGNFAACNNQQFDVEGTLSVIFKAAQNSFAFCVGSNPQASKCHQCVTGSDSREGNE